MAGVPIVPLLFADRVCFLSSNDRVLLERRAASAAASLSARATVWCFRFLFLVKDLSGWQSGSMWAICPGRTAPPIWRQLFKQYGDVAAAEVIMDRETGRSRGFGFVQMANDADMEPAINALNGQDCNGRPLVVNEARERTRASRRWRRWWWLRRRRWRPRWRRRWLWRRWRRRRWRWLWWRRWWWIWRWRTAATAAIATADGATSRHRTAVACCLATICESPLTHPDAAACARAYAQRGGTPSVDRKACLWLARLHVANAKPRCRGTRLMASAADVSRA